MIFTNASSTETAIINTCSTHVATQWIAGGDLALPIKICVQEDTNHTIIVWEPTTDIYGVGPTLAEAIMDFRAALNDHRAVLEDKDSLPLHPRMARQLAFLHKYLKP